MDFKRFNGSTWETVQHKIYGSGTDSLTAFPAMIQASGEPLTDYLISGNTIQDGTPTPEDPVDVVGCGVRTENLLNNGSIVEGGWQASVGTEPKPIDNLRRCRYSDFFAVASKTILYDFKDLSVNIVMMDSNGLSLGGTGFLSGAGSITFLSNTEKISLIIANSDITDYITVDYARSKNISLDYGFKLTPTVSGTEYPIYLGQAPTTRRIKKLVLDGAEMWYAASTTQGHTRFTKGGAIDANADARSNIVCTHLVYNPDYNKVCVFITSTPLYLSITMPGKMTVADFKSYLAAQYAANTPVTVWYVRATPETAVVNEPIHKIGDYADTITMAQAEVTIPTFDGDNTITFGTTVQPSGMNATFKGWHPVQGAKQYDGSEWR